MGLTGYFRSVRVARIAALVLGGTLVAAAIPAEACLSHPTIGGPISDGFFPILGIARGQSARAAISYKPAEKGPIRPSRSPTRKAS